MEILNKYLLHILMVGAIFSCVDPVVEKNENTLAGEWIIEEIYVDFDIPSVLYETDVESNAEELSIPEDLHIIQVLYHQQDGAFINDIDFTDELVLADAYTITLRDNGLYDLQVKGELDSLNIMEFAFQWVAPYFIETYFPEVEEQTEYLNGDYEYYYESYEFFLDYEYFSSSFEGSVPQGIWETVNLGEQILFDYTHPLYEEGSNLWDIEIVDDNTIILSQFGESSPDLRLLYTEESETNLDGVEDSYEFQASLSNTATINNASIVLIRK